LLHRLIGFLTVTRIFTKWAVCTAILYVGMQKLWDVVAVGDFFIDEVLSDFNSLPKLGEEAFAHRFHRDIGGGAAITACGLARLGVKVAVLGVVGREDGMWLVKRLMDAGVNATALEHHPTEPTGLTVSVSTREDRAFFSYYGANDRLRFLLKEPESKRLMARAKHVHFACAPDHVLNAGLFTYLRRQGCRISIDVGWHPSWLTDARNLHMLQEADLFFPNDREAELMTGESEPHRMLRVLRDRGIRAVGLKLGGRGAALAWKKHEFVCDPLDVTHVDTTGAGDCFDAGFIYAWLSDEEPEDCLQIANICGALSTRALGGLASFPTLDEVKMAHKGKGQAV
jgi:sugar/nucleoside kinase (ribokinase family)